MPLVDPVTTSNCSSDTANLNSRTDTNRNATSNGDKGNDSQFKDRTEDLRTEEEKKAAEERYTEAIEEEYAKREGGA